MSSELPFKINDEFAYDYQKRLISVLHKICKVKDVPVEEKRAFKLLRKDANRYLAVLQGSIPFDEKRTFLICEPCMLLKYYQILLTMIKAHLTKENFFDELERKFPVETNEFYVWLDQWKINNDWNALFGKKLKFHDLPRALQLGIWQEFVESRFPMSNQDPMDLSKAIEIFMQSENLRNINKHTS